MAINYPFIGSVCVVRTRSSGVFFGRVDQYEAKEAIVKDARRLWYWNGAASLSQLACEGVKNPHDCKFPRAVESVFLTEVIEIIPATKEAEESISSVPVWES